MIIIEDKSLILGHCKYCNKTLENETNQGRISPL